MQNQEKKKDKKKGSFFWLMSVAFIAVGLLLFCQFFFGDAITDETKFYQNTHINGVDVSGLTKAQAKDVIESKMLEKKDEIRLTLTSGDKEWVINGSDFEVATDIENQLTQVIEYGRTGNIFNKKKIENKIKKEGLNVNISYKNILCGMDEKLEEIAEKVDSQAVMASVQFDPNKEEMFTISKAQSGLSVDRDLLESRIDEALQGNLNKVIEIPTKEIMPNVDLEEMIKRIKLRSSFSTKYATSSLERKTNVRKALDAFNGMIVEPNEEVSFNKTTGARTVENGYKKASIIVGGVYVSGAGGGVCQASTTLYNALLLADIDVVQCNHHSLPASYVPLSFDAMVSEGYSDLIFKNNLSSSIYIKTYYNEEEVFVEIYGPEFEEGMEIKTRAELVKVLPHSGDKIVKDAKGEYSDKILYKGEYYRLKYPREGYETKGYIQYYKNGELMEEKLVRHDHYQPQNGVIMEGTEELVEGMTLPASNVKYIPPQKVTKETTESIKRKLEATYPSAYNQ